uniref:Uncharacterized protein n=1 Tax=viral metagenome TaxID=1070528 RepID=A0A6C0B6R4_9ZZZZ
MKYFDFKNDSTTIPKNISNYALYSGQIFIFGAIITCFMRHYYLSMLMFLLYVSTMLFWSNVHIEYLSNEKIADSLIGTSVILLATFYYARNYFKNRFKNIWYISISISVFVFIINEIIYYLNITKNNNFVNLIEQNLIHNISVFSHIIFLHIMPVFTYIYCAASSI